MKSSCSFVILKKFCNVLFRNQGACLHFAVVLTYKGMRHDEYIRMILWDSLIFSHKNREIILKYQL